MVCRLESFKRRTINQPNGICFSKSLMIPSDCREPWTRSDYPQCITSSVQLISICRPSLGIYDDRKPFQFMWTTGFFLLHLPHGFQQFVPELFEVYLSNIKMESWTYRDIPLGKGFGMLEIDTPNRIVRIGGKKILVGRGNSKCAGIS